MRHSIECKIVNIANQLSFAYRSLAPELQVFVSPSTELTKATDFICALEEKQEVWYEMMTTPATSHRYYNPARRPSAYSHRLLLASQSEAFLRYQSQQPYIADSPQGFAATLLPNATQIPYQRQYFQPQRPQHQRVQNTQQLQPQPRQQQLMFPNTNPKEFARAPGQSYPVNARPEPRQDALPSSRILTPSFGDGHLPNPRQPYQSTPYQHAYQVIADDKEVESKPPPEKVLEVLYGG